MKAAVFHKPGQITCDTVEDPRIGLATDVILKVTATAICGSDLHILSGAVPQKEPMIMGHEFMGVVEEVGKEVKNLKPGDRVVVPFPIACGHCFFCQHGASPACENSNYKTYGPEGDLMDGKARPYLVILISTAAIPAGRHNMYGCPMVTSVRGLCPRT